MTASIDNPDTLRNADVATLAETLNSQRTRAVDVVAPASAIRVVGNRFEFATIEQQVTDDGVTDPNGLYVPTLVALEQIAGRLEIPMAYLRRMHGTHPVLFAQNVNGWLERDSRKFLLRLMMHATRPGEDVGVVRAFMSDTYRVIDNFDVLLAALKGLTDAGVTDPIIHADLTDRRMIVRVQVPQIAAMAPTLLADYRSPFTGERINTHGWTPERMAAHNADMRAGRRPEYDPGDPVVFAGLVITNSETGGGAFNIYPELTVRICDNGMTISADALRKVHIGARLDEGVVKWSEQTAANNLALVTSQTTDAVRTFVSADYLQAKVAELEKEAGAEIADPTTVVAGVSQRLGFTEAQQRDILAHFVKGGQLTAGGVLQAVTSASQLVADGDDAFDMNTKAVQAMRVAAELAAAPAR